MSDNQVRIDIEARVDGLRASLAAAEKDLDAFKASAATRSAGAAQEMDAATIAARGLAVGVGAVSGAVVAAGAAWAAYSAAQVVAALSIKDAADEAGKLSQRLGMPIQQISELRYAAEMSNVGLNELTSGMKHLANQMQAALSGDRRAAALFEAMNIGLVDAGGRVRSLDAVFGDVIERMSGYADGAAKTALANDLLGRGVGERLIPMLNQGAEGFREMADEAHRLGIVYDEQLARQSEELNDNMTRLRAGIDGVRIAMGRDMVPVLNRFIEDIVLANKHSTTFFEGLMNFATRGGWAGSVGGKIAELRADLARLREIEEVAPTADIREKISAAQRELEYNLERQSQAALAKTGRRYMDARDLALNGNSPDAPTPRPASSGPGGDALDATRYNLDLMRQAEKELRELDAAQVEYLRNVQALIGPVEDRARAMEREVEFYGMTESRIQEVMVARLEEARALAAQNGAWPAHLAFLDREIEARKRLGAAAGEKDSRDAWAAYERDAARAAERAAEKQTREYQKSADDINRALTDAIMDGGQDGGEMLQRYFANLILRPVVSAVMDPVAKEWAGIATSATAGIGDWLRTAFSSGYGDLEGLAAGVPQYAVGTPYVPEDGLAYLHKGERVLTADENRAWSAGGGVVVNLIEAPGNGGQVRQRDDGNTRTLDIMIERFKAETKAEIAGDIMRGSGVVPAAMASRYGLSAVPGA